MLKLTALLDRRFGRCLRDSIYELYEPNTDQGLNPDVVLVGCGVETTFEVRSILHYLPKVLDDIY
ncbi:hypothetical protein BC936DRAFT_146467 [Jimgerdemannia flammicorona]|uniref:Uncharacterized protein n=1 Tax=Jimgerdemannia flammicorona TaxID=994334 RepID=A0A433D7L7_9FUNG|nr:hypothetical protein BC936DRAFT_146467 [Jimgerdemannia flammicorona]